jgi:hypothetical protein
VIRGTGKSSPRWDEPRGGVSANQSLPEVALSNYRRDKFSIHLSSYLQMPAKLVTPL